MAVVDRLGEELAGLDVLDTAAPRGDRARRLWSSLWPKLAAVALGLVAWQAVVWSGWKPEYVLAGPVTTFEKLGQLVADGTIWSAVATTMRRAVVGFALAVVIGVALGSVIARSRVLRAAFGSLITGIQTMPSIAWFPLAILLFKISEQAITFVVVVGAAPAVANGLIAGADHIPPLQLRAGRMLGATGFTLYRHVVLPASLPGLVTGLKQGWAFAWRSLMAGELIVIIANRPSVGSLLSYNRELADSAGLLAMMTVVLVIGILVDSLVFGTLDRAVRRRWGLLESAGG